MTHAGYGVSVFGGRFTGTPEFGFGLSESGRDYSLGWRLAPEGGNAGSFEFSLEATRREAANGDGSEHGVSLRATMSRPAAPARGSATAPRRFLAVPAVLRSPHPTGTA